MRLRIPIYYGNVWGKYSFGDFSGDIAPFPVLRRGNDAGRLYITHTHEETGSKLKETAQNPSNSYFEMGFKPYILAIFTEVLCGLVPAVVEFCLFYVQGIG